MKHIIFILITTIGFYSCKKELTYGEQLVRQGKVYRTVDTRSYRADLISGKYVKRDSNRSTYNLDVNISINEDFKDGKVYYDSYNNILYKVGNGIGSKSIYQYLDPSKHELKRIQYSGTEYIYVRDEYGTLIEEKEINDQGIVQYSKKYIYDDYNRLNKTITRDLGLKYVTEYGSTQKANGLIDNFERTTFYHQDGRSHISILYRTINKWRKEIVSISKEEYIENVLELKKSVKYEYSTFRTLLKETFYGWKRNGTAVTKKNSKYLLPEIDHFEDQIEQYIMSFDRHGNPTKYRAIFNRNTMTTSSIELIDRDITDNYNEPIRILEFDCKYYYDGDDWIKAELSLLIEPGRTEYYIIERDIKYYE